MIPSLWNKVVNFIETKGRRVLPGAGGRSNGELAFNGYGVSVLQVQGGRCWWLFNNVNVLNAPETVHLKMVNFMSYLFHHNKNCYPLMSPTAPTPKSPGNWNKFWGNKAYRSFGKFPTQPHDSTVTREKVLDIGFDFLGFKVQPAQIPPFLWSLW